MDDTVRYPLSIYETHKEPEKFPQAVLENIQAGIPGKSKELPGRYDIFGKLEKRSPIKTFGGFGFNTAREQTKIEREMERLNVIPGSVSRNTTVSGSASETRTIGSANIKLPRDLEASYQAYSGQGAMALLSIVVNDDTWDGRSDANKKVIINNVFSKYRDEVMSLLKEQYAHRFDALYREQRAKQINRGEITREQLIQSR